MARALLRGSAIACTLIACARAPAHREATLASARDVHTPSSDPTATRIVWEEHFGGHSLDWLDPFGHEAVQLARVYSVRSEDGVALLHARYDGTASDRPPAMHYGKPFKESPAPLERVRALKWRWRALRHPAPNDDAWLDLAAGIYVVMKTPTLLSGGRGFKFGWLQKPGPAGTHQHGLLQVALRTEPATREWREESVDLCALYRREFGDCEGEHVLYVGVVTDGDNTRSVAEADYADFALVEDAM